MIRKLLASLVLAIFIATAVVVPLQAASTIDNPVIGGARYSSGNKDRYGETISEESQRFEIYKAPHYTPDSEGNWVAYVFTEELGHYRVQAARASVKFYDYYTEVWTEDFSSVSIYDDRWTVEYQNKQGRWTDAGFWNTTRSYKVIPNGIELKRIGDTVIGQRQEIYTFRAGEPCKIEIRQTCDDTQTIRFVWKPSGIVASYELAEYTEDWKQQGLAYYDSSNNFVTRLQWFDELSIADTIEVSTESHTQGRKTTVTFGTFAVDAGGIAYLDPLYEHYNTGDDASVWFYGVTWKAQTFTPSTAHKVTSVKLKLYRSGTPGTITVSIRETDGEGHPTGEDLCSGTTDGNTLPTVEPYEWREITLGDGYNLDVDTKYAIVVRVPSLLVRWCSDYNDATYPGGNREGSPDSGTSWSATPNDDHMFEEWGIGAPGTPTNVSATDGVHTDKVVVTWTKSAGATKYEVFRDNVGLGELGDVATYDDNGADAGTVTPGTASASDGTSDAHITLSLAGESANNGTTHTYKVKAGSAIGWSGYSDSDTGYRGVGAVTYQWYRSAADSDAAYAILGGATTDPYNDATAPADGSGRWYYCKVSATGAVTQDSTHDRGNRAVTPTITTVVCSGFGADWAILNGIVTDDGGATLTTAGFNYGLTDAYGSSSTKTVSLTTGDEFWIKITGLDPGSVYHYQAKATNGGGEDTGDDMVFSTEGSATLYEYVNTGGTIAGDDIYAGNWSAQQFTVLTVAHSLDFVNIYVIRTGVAPGNATLSIRHADVADKPTGTDLDSVTLNANNFSAALDWVKFDFPNDITLEAGESYALVLKCPNGTAANYLEWRLAAGTVLANAVASNSTDSGITWTLEPAGADFLFEVWGEPVLEVLGAQVFTGYIETGDWLVVATYRNYFKPYYPNQSCPANFYLRLLDDTTMVAQTGCPAWRYRPGSFYFSKALADSMEWGATDYIFRMYGDFGTYPHTDYNIAAADWRGADLEFLDAWVIEQANIIGDDIGIELTTEVEDRGEVLNATGRAMFILGIPDLEDIRPDIFAFATWQPDVEESDYTGALQAGIDWETKVGTTVAGILTTAGTMAQIDGKDVGALICVALMVGVVILVIMKGGSFRKGMLLSSPLLMVAAWFGLIDLIIIAVIVSVLGVSMLAYKVWLR